jgi:hypothetical protein
MLRHPGERAGQGGAGSSPGRREPLTVRPANDVVPLPEAKSVDSGVSSMSQHLADLVAIHTGRPDSARGLGTKQRQELPLAM